jgi:hypothetical protein
MRLITLLIFFSLVQKFTNGQSHTQKDFKLILEGHSLKDSTITFSELSKLNKVTANFSWLHVNELNISYGGQCFGGNGYFETNCKGNSICNEAILSKRFFGTPGAFIVISSSNTTDKSGKKVMIQPILLWLTE